MLRGPAEAENILIHTGKTSRITVAGISQVMEREKMDWS
jgi:hypothetical protein